jgi:hypothetical protein
MGDGSNVGKDKAVTVIAYILVFRQEYKPWTVYMGCQKTIYWIALTRIAPDARRKYMGNLKTTSWRIER